MRVTIITILYFFFFVLAGESGYLYSIRWNWVSWGSSQREGLFFLAFYTVILPLLIAISVIKCYLLRHAKTTFIKYSFFAYLAMVGLPAIDTFGSQKTLALGTSASLIICVCALGEFVKYRKQF
jgi:hypothetical protein